MGEIFRGLNCQEIQFLWIVAPGEILNPIIINFVFEKFAHAKWSKQSHSTRRLCIRRHHVYQNIWEVAVGGTVAYMLEPGNFHDRNAVIFVEKDGRIFGHLPRKVSRIFSEDRWNHLLHCDWKRRYMYIGKTTRQTKVTDYSCNLLYHSSSNFFNVIK